MDDIPQLLDEIDAPMKGLKVPKRQRKRQPSFFHFVLNPNISYKAFKGMGRPEKVEFFKAAKSAFEEMREALDTNRWGCKKDMSDSRRKRLERFDVYTEVGGQRGFLHFDGVIKFDAYCQLNFHDITNHFNDRLKPWSKGVHLNVRVVHDHIRAAEDYASKDGSRLI